MELLDAVMTRHCYRGTYTDAPVSREDLKKIVEAGWAAPSGCNRQTTRFIAVDDPALLKELRGQMEQPVGHEAPAMVCVLYREIPGIDGRLYHVQDYSAALENMLLAIHALGYASCWYEGQTTGPDGLGRKMAGLLGAPQGWELVCFLPVGRPAQEVKGPGKQPFSERAWLNGFGKSWE